MTLSPLTLSPLAAGVTLTGVPGIDWGLLAPVLAPVVALLLVLLLDAVAPGHRLLRPVQDAVTLLGLAAAAGLVAWLSTTEQRSTACLSGSDSLLPECSFEVDRLALALMAVVLVAAFGCVLLAFDSPVTRADEKAHAPYQVLLLTAVAGTLALAGARDLATLVIALETASLPAIALVALRRDGQGAQAAVTMLITAVGSLGLLVTGVGLLVLTTGSLHFEVIATALSGGTATGPGTGLDPHLAAVAGLGALLALAGLAFKLSLVPFHLWTPDTYAGAPLPVAVFLATVSKVAGLAAVAVFLTMAVMPLAHAWAPVLAVLAGVSMTVGNLVALRQTHAVRLLAWSTVAQAGWVVLPFAAADATPGGALPVLSASVGYLLAYVVASLAVFSVVVLVARHQPDGEEHSLETYRGLSRTEPVASGVLVLGLLCLAGLPPGVMGLVAKVVVLRPVVDAQQWGLAVVAALNVALGLAYYLRWAGLVAARPASGQVLLRWKVRPAEGIALGAAGAACVVLSVGGQLIAGLLG
ncbi:NADH-quinone oxidoreductase subunit N [Spongisporangium articulatum]|uniref:NADH-quinone oxidoreductase subunit N n=1 Tax=Spongisporangium articulatum TaxID=3362603 RepID=A0ABW8ANV2_9ACTN